jgi:anthranilate synthase component 1
MPPNHMTQITVVPSLETAKDVINRSKDSKYPPNLLPLTASIPADLLTPTLAYLKIADK